jgi:glycogen(starch) synthase
VILRPGTPGRVLMTADTVGGVWTYAVELSRTFGTKGIEVVLATMGGLPTSGQRDEIAALPNVRLFESEFRLPWMDHPWDDVGRAGAWLLDLAQQLEPDIIHLNEPVYAALPWAGPTVAVAHSCVLSWWESVWHTSAPAQWDQYAHAMREGLQAADQVVAPSTWMLNEVRRLYDVRGGQVIPNGRDSQGLTPEPKAPLIFAAGRLWDEAKNLIALEQIADELSWPIYIAGDARHPSGFEPVKTSHSRLLGRLSTEDTASWLRRAGIYAFPAKYEPFGLSVLEAALAGCAMVLSDLPTLRERWEGAAIFVAPDEHPILRLAVESLIADSGLRHTLAMRARRRALDLTPERMARGYLALYRELLARRAPYTEAQACAS